MSLRQRKRAVHFPQRVVWTLRYRPNNRVCDIDSGYCWSAYPSRAAAGKSVGRHWMKEVSANYRVCKLPAFIPAAPGYRKDNA